MENIVNQIHRGNCIDVMQKIPDESVDCVITSPPYWQLRHYEGIPDYIWGGDKECEHEFDIKSQKNPLDRGGKGQFESGIAANMGKSASLPFNAGFCTKCGAWKGQLGLEPKFEMFLEHLYMIMDVYSRKIVGWQIYEFESSELAADLIEDVCRREGIQPSQMTLHSDNGGPMKGATMLATLKN